MAIISGMGRWATEGMHIQRHNGDGTIPTPRRFLGFANAADLTGALANGLGQISIKIDHRPSDTKTVSFAGAANLAEVTVAEAVAALNEAGFADVRFFADPQTGRLRGSHGTGKPASLTVELRNNGLSPHAVPAGNYQLLRGGRAFAATVTAPMQMAEAAAAVLTVELSNSGAADYLIEAGVYSVELGGHFFTANVTDPLSLEADGGTGELELVADAAGELSALPSAGDPFDASAIVSDSSADISGVFLAAAQGAEGGTALLEFAAVESGEIGLPAVGDPVEMASLTPRLSADFSGTFAAATQGANPDDDARIVQIWSPLAGALDFGQSARHGGEGLKVLSFFGDELISATLPKDVKDREEIDLESAKGTIKRMVIGATYLGMSPVLTFNQKNYELTELVQGGKLNRDTGTYNPPKPNESEHPTFWYKIFSAIYGDGTHMVGNVGGYETLFLRNASGIEGDTSIDTKAWATYPINTTCVGYTDENGGTHTAWEEGTLTLEEFDALRLNRISA